MKQEMLRIAEAYDGLAERAALLAARESKNPNAN
jgi:hypothetical protein